jgi:hypothetical protein
MYGVRSLATRAFCQLHLWAVLAEWRLESPNCVLEFALLRAIYIGKAERRQEKVFDLG